MRTKSPSIAARQMRSARQAAVQRATCAQHPMLPQIRTPRPHLSAVPSVIRMLAVVLLTHHPALLASNSPEEAALPTLIHIRVQIVAALSTWAVRPHTAPAPIPHSNPPLAISRPSQPGACHHTPRRAISGNSHPRSCRPTRCVSFNLNALRSLAPTMTGRPRRRASRLFIRHANGRFLSVRIQRNSTARPAHMAPQSPPAHPRATAHARDAGVTGAGHSSS